MSTQRVGYISDFTRALLARSGLTVAALNVKIVTTDAALKTKVLTVEELEKLAADSTPTSLMERRSGTTA
jgi:hypothetical protein